MRILLTGVAGFVGSNLTEQLLKNGHSIIGIDNLSYGELRNIEDFKDHKNFTFINGDFCNYSLVEDLEVDLLIHLASQKIPRYSNSLRTLEENQAMIKNAIAKCQADNIRLLFSSTSDVYGKNPQIPFSEESNLVLGPTDVKRWAYAVSKIYSEHLIIANGEAHDLDYTIVRFFGSYGKNQNLTWWGGPQSGFITKANNDEEIEIHGTGLQTRTFTYIKDTVNALVLCVEKEKEASKQIYNIANEADEEVTIIELAEIIWKLVNKDSSKAKLNFIPYSTFGKYEDVMRRVPDITKIKKELGFKPQYSLKVGLKETIEWQLNLIK
ncbi:MAG: UDP-glucose 4-epimerase [Planctomycetota bacterium]|jgi:UDP-glucose 4-epimerase